MKVAIVGAGIVGVATARAVQRRWPRAQVLLLDKEAAPARHQTGRNSGVIHAGVYYPPESLKAKLCRRGLAATYAFARAHGIAHRQTGKLIVASSEAELSSLARLADRAVGNGLQPEHLTERQLRARAPGIVGRGALFVPETGIVDYGAVTETCVQQFLAAGGVFYPCSRLQQIRETADSVQLRLYDGRRMGVDKLMVCAGLQADRMVRAQDLVPDFAIVPFRGEYWALRPGAVTLKHLIYPVPDPALPFLGVHLTLMVGGQITAGPNAVLSLHREGYAGGVDWRDLVSSLGYPGFWRMLARFPRAAVREWHSSGSKRRFLARIQTYCPAVQLSDLQPWPSGIRAQALAGNGELLQDFHFLQTDHCLHVCNAPSPAATSAFPIADHLADKFEELVA